MARRGPTTAREGEDWSRALVATDRYLRSGVRSTQEALLYLRRRGLPEGAASRVIAGYRARGLLDDVACARLWAEHWSRRGYAWVAIHHKLSARGLDEHAIEQAVQWLGASSDDETRARLLAAQHARRSPPRQQRVRVARALASRGFDSDLIERILHESFGPTPSDAER